MHRSDAQVVLADRYELGAVLGAGGMGNVHDATDRRLGRAVAVKMLRADLAGDPTARRRFETEARAAAHLTHPNVVTVFDSGEDDGIPFLVMERLPGRTLAHELASGPLTLTRAGRVGGEVLAALGAAHSAGIVHRDMKPGNVLLTSDGHVKVSDFGIAKTIDDADQTQTADLVATVRYLAPERLTGAPATPASDVYSVGVVLYEALSGRCAFDGDTPVATMRAVERGAIPALTEVPPEVAAVVERAMATAFEHATHHASTPASNAYDDTESIPVPPTAAVTAPLPPSRPRTRRPSRRLGVGVAIAMASVSIIGLAWNARGGSTRGPGQLTRSVPAPTAPLPAPLDNAVSRLERAVGE